MPTLCFVLVRMKPNVRKNFIKFPFLLLLIFIEDANAFLPVLPRWLKIFRIYPNANLLTCCILHQ